MKIYETLSGAVYGMLDVAQDVVQAYRDDLCIDAAQLGSMTPGMILYQVLRRNGTNLYQKSELEHALYDIKEYWSDWYVLVKWTRTNGGWIQEICSAAEVLLSAMENWL